MGISIVYPASAGRCQGCPRDSCCLNLEITLLNNHFVVAVSCKLRSQDFFIDSHRFLCICSLIAYGSKIALIYKICYSSCKCRILFIKELLCIVYRDRCCLWCDLQGYIVSRQVFITCFRCFYRYGYESFRYVGYIRSHCTPFAVSSLIINCIARSIHQFGCRCMGCSIVGPASTGCCQFRILNESGLNSKVSLHYGYNVVAV